MNSRDDKDPTSAPTIMSCVQIPSVNGLNDRTCARGPTGVAEDHRLLSTRAPTLCGRRSKTVTCLLARRQALAVWRPERACNSSVDSNLFAARLLAPTLSYGRYEVDLQGTPCS